MATFPHFFLRLGRYGLFTLLLISASVAIATFGYRHFADLGWIDSFYMSCMILTGMGASSEMATTNAKLFSSFYALYSGVPQYHSCFLCSYHPPVAAYTTHWKITGGRRTACCNRYEDA